MLPEQFIQELKLNSDIEAVVSSYVQLKRGGRHLMGLCPFHSEKSPSFTVYTDTQSFFCFGCGAGGDVINFIKRVENLEYIDAVKHLVDRAGMRMPESGFDDSAAKLKTRILEVNRQTARFYHSCLMQPQGKAALNYLHGRGLGDKTIRHFGLGYSPEGWDALTKQLKAQGFSEEELQQARVAGKGKNGSYDMFRNRVMFPIIDIRGNVIAFGGRIMSGDGPKYLNSPDTPVFKKSRNLFALNLAKGTTEERLLLAEGYMDVIALHQAGFTNAVATLGTALTDEQARMISQYVKQVVIAYDSDGAGQTATKRAINIFSEIGVQVRVLQMQGAKDPDEFIKKFGRDRFKLLVEGSTNALEFELGKIAGKYDTATADGKVNYLKEFAQFMAGVNNPIEREVYIAKAANELEVSKAVVLDLVDKTMRRKTKAKEKKDAKELKVFASVPMDKVNPERGRNLKGALAEERLLAILLKNPDYYASISQKISPQDFVTDFNRRIFEIICQRIQSNSSLDLSVFGSVLDDAQMGRVAGLLASASGQSNTKEETDDYIKTIKESKLQKTDKDIAEMNDSSWSKYISDLAAQKK